MRKRRRFVFAVAGGVVVIGAATAAARTLDRVAGDALNRLRPDLEQALSKPLGHPVEIGEYRGLRPWGLAVGPSRIPSSTLDRSELSLEGLRISLDPLASLRQWQPVLQLDLLGLRGQLEPNEDGRYWTPGKVEPGGEPPRLVLRYRLVDPARISIGPGEQILEVEAQGAVQLADASFSTIAQLRWAGEAGRVRLEGHGRWNRPAFSLRSRIEGLDLKPFSTVLQPSSGVRASGQLAGDFRVRWSADQLRCRGGLRLNNLQIASADAEPLLRSPRIGIGCKEGQLSISPSTLQFRDFQAAVSGGMELNRRFDLKARLRRRNSNDVLNLQVKGPWAEPEWTAEGRLQLPESSGLKDALKIEARLRTPWTQADQRRVLIDRLNVNSPALRLGLAGTLGRDLDLRTTELRLSPRLWQDQPAFRSSLGDTTPILGGLDLRGELSEPEIGISLGQARNPLLEQWDLRARWAATDSVLMLERFTSSQLRAEAQLPLRLEQGELRTGELQSGLELKSFDLSRLSSLTGIELSGQFSARGRVNGPLQQLRPDLALMLSKPRVGPVLVPERWDGRLSGSLGGDLRLRLAAQKPALNGELEADLKGSGGSAAVRFNRGAGQLQLDGADGRYRWNADQLDLDGLQLVHPSLGQSKSIAGQLNGSGQLALTPLTVRGSMAIDEPSLAGVVLERAELEGELVGGRYGADVTLTPAVGAVQLRAEGSLAGALSTRLDAKGLDVGWLLAMTRQLRGQDPSPGLDPGRAEDLGTLLINTFGGSLDGQLKALAESRRALEAYAQANPQQEPALDQLEGRLDAVAEVEGPNLNKLVVDLEARAHLWLEGDDQAQALQLEPVVATIQGPLKGGTGDLALLQIPLSLLGLVAPVPPALKGRIGARGRYSLGTESPLFEADLQLEDASLTGQPLVLEQRSIVVDRDSVRVALALRGGASKELIELSGAVPFDPAADLDLKLESHGDALRVLARLAGDSLTVRGGSTDLRLLLRGPLQQPEANGFLIVSKGDLRFGDQELSRINASVLFDFDRLELQQLEAQMGSDGTLRGKGTIGLFRPMEVAEPLKFEISKGQIRQSIVAFQADGQLSMDGALIQPELSGALTLSKGTLRPQAGLLSRLRSGGAKSLIPTGVQGLDAAASLEPVEMTKALADQWDFKEPLVLIGPNAPIQGADQIQKTLPNLPGIRFRNLRLTLGPDLRVVMPPWISFKGGGLLILNGPLDPTLQARGVIRLDSGRVSLFSTTFRLDPRASNVAVFAPSSGLVPYVDIAMRSRVSDTVSVGNGNQTTSSNIFDANGSGSAYAGGGQLRLVKVTVQATGFANRLKGNLDLRSSPPMSKSQLMAMIGGNSLSGLADGGGAALATVVGQSLLSPVLGTLTDALGQRIQVALFPTYVTPNVKSDEERTSGRVPPTLTLVSEIGVDVTDRFDFSVLAAPNTSDVPPQATVSYRVAPNTTLSGAVDSNGTWQSQLQVFFRF